MEQLLTISTEHGGRIYAITYILTFLIIIPILAFLGHKKKFPLLSWSLLLILTQIVFIAGTKIITYSTEEWSYLLSQLKFPRSYEASILGGFIAFLFLIVIIRIAFKAKPILLEPFALAIPIGMIIQKIGCIFAGCCFGNPSTLPWAINYTSGSQVWHYHVSSHLIESSVTQSLSIHPVQIYQIALLGIVMIIIWRSRLFFKASGNIFFFSIFLVSIVRFITEFFRDPISERVGSDIIFLMKNVQWLLIFVCLVLIFLIIYREKYCINVNKIKAKALLCNGPKNFIIFSTIIVLLCSGYNWFLPVEYISICLFLIPVVVGVSLQLNRRITHRGFRWGPISLFLGCILLMGQTFQNNIELPKPSDDDYTSINFGMMFGGYEDYWGSCDGPSYAAKRKYVTTGIGVSHISSIPGKRKKYGEFRLGATFGSDNPIPIYGINFKSENKTVIGIGGSYRVDWEYFGIGGGAQLGSLHASDSNDPTDPTGILPIYYMRVGQRSILFAELNWFDHLPSPFPTPNLKYGLGTGFGRSDGTYIKIGGTEYQFPYVSGAFIINKKFVLEPFFAFKSSKNNYDPIYSMTFHYRFMK